MIFMNLQVVAKVTWIILIPGILDVHVACV